MADTNNREAVTASVIAQYTLVVIGVLITAAFLFLIKDALLMAFAGIIFAVIINGFAGIIRRYIPISRGWSIAVVGIIILTVMTSFGLFFGSQIVEEVKQFTEKLPQQISQVRETISEWSLGDELTGGEDENGKAQEQEQKEDENSKAEDQKEDEKEKGFGDTMPAGAGGKIFQLGVGVVDILATVGLILITGIYFVIDPKTYKKSIALLFTKKRADRVNEALETCGKALWTWLSGQFIVMIFVGVTVTIGLMVIGVPLALVLGIIAGISEFIPIIGPWIGAVFGVLFAFSVDGQTALYTAIFYFVIQQVESNLLTPLIQQHMVHIPPAVVILSVVAFGTVFGIAGIILATPLAVIAMVLVGMFYVQDVLGKEIKIIGQDHD